MISALTQLGLDAKQASTYCTLMELGEASMTELARTAQLKRPTAYLVVEQLQLMGLVSETTVGKRKRYTAVHPRRLLEIARFREQQIENMLPELLATYNTPKQKPKIQVFEGERGVSFLYRELYDSLEKKREEALFFTRIDALRQHMPMALIEYKEMLIKIGNPRIRELNYNNAAAREWFKEMQPFMRENRNQLMRLLPMKFEYGATDMIIFGNRLSLFNFADATFVTLIESEQIVKSMRVLFEWSWTCGLDLAAAAAEA